MEASVNQALYRLQRAADTLIELFPSQKWYKVSGSGAEVIEQDGMGNFAGMVWEPGSKIILRCQFTIPEEVGGVDLVGDPLDAIVTSLYPVRLRWKQNQPVFEANGVPVASGPILATAIPCLQAGENGELTLEIDVPQNQTTQWFNLRFSTPRLRQRFELLDVAWAELALAEALAATSEERIALLQAVELVPVETSQFDANKLKKMEAALTILEPKARSLLVHVIGHSHIDMNWLWTWEDTVRVILRDFQSVLDLMDDYPELTFTHSQPATYEVVRQEAPALFARVLDRIREGRWEPATLTWVEGDENMASGEALARHLLEGVTYSREVLGFQPTAFLAPDTFGHPGNLPQLGVSAGAQIYYHHRCNPGGFDQWPAYWWEGQDGSRILAVSTPSYNGEIRARDLVEAALHGYKYGHQNSLHFHGIGDHGGGPSRHNLDALHRLQQKPMLPTAQCSTLASYARAILASGVSLPHHRGESSTIFEGCYTTHANIKRFNRLGENLLCTAETLSALANLDFQEELRDAWRKVLFNQFHDLLDGSAIHESYQKSAADFAEVSNSAQAVIAQSLQCLSGKSEPGSITVTNPLGWECSGWVWVSGKPGKGYVRLVSDQGHQTVGQYSPEGLGFVAQVPALGTARYQIEGQLSGDSGLSVTMAAAPGSSQWINSRGKHREPPYYCVDTPFFRVYVRRDSGIITSFFDKRVERELVSFGMRHPSDYFDTARPDLAFNVFQLLDERPHAMSAWHMDEVQSERSLIDGGSVSVLEQGLARVVFEVKHRLRQSEIRQEIIFYHDLPQVDFHTVIDWHEPGNWDVGVPNLKIAFTSELPEVEAWFETPFAAVQRPCNGQEVPALRWIDVGGADYGVALLNDSKYGFDVLGSRLRMTLVRSAYEPDQIADQGLHEICYRLFPHPGGWREASVVKAAAEFNQPLLAYAVPENFNLKSSPQTWRPGLVGNPAVLFSSLKTAKDGQGKILRLYESAGSTGAVEIFNLPEKAAVWEVSLVEDKQKALEITAGKVSLDFHPWQVRTIYIRS